MFDHGMTFKRTLSLWIFLGASRPHLWTRLIVALMPSIDRGTEITALTVRCSLIT